MIRLILLSLLAAIACSAQSPYWFGAGGGSGTSGGNGLGWAALAVPIGTSQVYSYSAHQIQGPHTSTTTGLATIIRQYKAGSGTFYLLGLATAGVAQGTATTGAFSGGGLGVWRSKSGWTWEIGAIQSKAGTPARAVLLMGFGKCWGGA